METKNIQNEEAVSGNTERKLQIGVISPAPNPRYAERTMQLAEETKDCVTKNGAVFRTDPPKSYDALNQNYDGLILITGGAGSELMIAYDADKAEMRKTGQVMFYKDTADVPKERCLIMESVDTPQKAVQLVIRRIREMAILDANLNTK